MNKTIEERAKEYAFFNMRDLETDIDEAMRFVENAYKDGAKDEHEELTKWNSPECPPDSTHEVLAKICGGYYKVVTFDLDSKMFRVSGTQEWIEIFGWREIHE